MKIQIEVDATLEEDEVVIRCARLDDTVQRIHQFVQQQGAPGFRLVFYKDGQEFYFPAGDVLFFETEGEQVYAHTEGDAFRTRYRLYELEKLLPPQFIRTAKSAIVNVHKIHAIERNLSASSRVRFVGTHKQIYVSRHYYRALKARLDERSHL